MADDMQLNSGLLLGNPDLVRALDVLNPAGEETRLVGGAVRNALLGLPAGDIDLATTMLPAEVIRQAKAARLRSIPTGIAHGTVTLLVRGQPFEVTTLREDVETDGRHAVVRFGRDFALDAQRRDFTINALSVGRDGEIHDTVGGIEDLANRRVRFIGDAATRIREDYLRILRFLRFHAIYGIGTPDAEGLEAAIDHRDGLARLSRERIRTEMLKILAAPAPLDVLRIMQAGGLLDLVLQGPADIETLERLARIDPTPADPILRLAALALRGPADLARLRDLLRLTNAEMKRLDAALRAGSDLPDIPGEASLLRLLATHGREASIDAVLLRAGKAEGDAEPWHHALAVLRDTPVPILPVGGGDLLRRGLQGPAVGIALARLRDLWATAGFPTDPTSLEALVDRAVDHDWPD